MKFITWIFKLMYKVTISAKVMKKWGKSWSNEQNIYAILEQKKAENTVYCEVITYSLPDNSMIKRNFQPMPCELVCQDLLQLRPDLVLGALHHDLGPQAQRGPQQDLGYFFWCIGCGVANRLQLSLHIWVAHTGGSHLWG